MAADVIVEDSGGGVLGDIYYVVRVRRASNSPLGRDSSEEDVFVAKSPNRPHPARILLQWVDDTNLRIWTHSVDVYHYQSVATGWLTKSDGLQAQMIHVQHEPVGSESDWREMERAFAHRR